MPPEGVGARAEVFRAVFRLEGVGNVRLIGGVNERVSRLRRRLLPSVLSLSPALVDALEKFGLFARDHEHAGVDDLQVRHRRRLIDRILSVIASDEFWRPAGLRALRGGTDQRRIPLFEQGPGVWIHEDVVVEKEESLRRAQLRDAVEQVLVPIEILARMGTLQNDHGQAVPFSVLAPGRKGDFKNASLPRIAANTHDGLVHLLGA